MTTRAPLDADRLRTMLRDATDLLDPKPPHDLRSVEPGDHHSRRWPLALAAAALVAAIVGVVFAVTKPATPSAPRGGTGPSVITPTDAPPATVIHTGVPGPAGAAGLEPLLAAIDSLGASLPNYAGIWVVENSEHSVIHVGLTGDVAATARQILARVPPDVLSAGPTVEFALRPHSLRVLQRLQSRLTDAIVNDPALRAAAVSSGLDTKRDADVLTLLTGTSHSLVDHLVAKFGSSGALVIAYADQRVSPDDRRITRLAGISGSG